MGRRPPGKYRTRIGNRVTGTGYRALGSGDRNRRGSTPAGLGHLRSPRRAQRSRPCRAGDAGVKRQALKASSVASSVLLPPFPASPFPHRDADGRAVKPEGLAQVVHQEAVVREVELGGDVREEDELRRRGARLRRIQDLHMRWRGLDGGCSRPTRCTNRLSSPVVMRFAWPAPRGPPSRAASAPLAGQRRDVQQRRVVEELHAEPLLLVEFLVVAVALALRRGPTCWRR